MGSVSDESKQHLLLDIDDEKSVTEPKFRIRNLTKRTETEDPILKGVCLDIPKGMIVGIIGPSGGGKSTLLRALNRLWEPDAGSVFIDGEDVCELDVLHLRRRVGMLFQVPVLFEGTVADNVRYGPQLQGQKLTDAEVSTLLTCADLDPSFAARNGNELSVGQAQRVALARTLANEPEHVEDTIVRLKKTHGLTTIMVSHSIKQIQRIADLACLVVEGQVVDILEPKDLSQAQHPMAQMFLELSS